MRKAIGIMGIHTGIGKTVASAILAESLRVDYWKPVQAGDLQNSDSKKVRSLLSNAESTVHPEAVRLNHPLSPHEAARLDGVEINFESMAWPKTPRHLLVETAGGVMSPINHEATMADFVSFYNLPVVLIVRHYLGSINHTLMSIDVLKRREINVLGLIIRKGMSITLIGIAVGLAIAFALTRLMTTLLFGVTPTDAITFAAVSAFVMLVALLACYIPARRATKISPLVALRYE